MEIFPVKTEKICTKKNVTEERALGKGKMIPEGNREVQE